MSLHKHNKVKFKGRVYYKQNIKGGRCDLLDSKGNIAIIGIKLEDIS